MEREPGKRVRLEQPGHTDRSGRTGCLAMGAVLGILAGIMTALYGLPPILNSLYGEKVVGPGEARTVGNIGFQVEGYTVGPDPYCLGLPACPPATIQVSVRVSAVEAWAPDTEDFLVEIEGIETWIEAIDPVGGAPDTALSWREAEARVAVLRFPLPLGATPDETEPVAVHITTPRARLELDRSLRR